MNAPFPELGFRHRRRVEFGETDMAGIVHFANFFRYMEAAETDFLRSLGYSVSWAAQGERFGFPRVQVQCDYLAPVHFEDELFVVVSLQKCGTSSLTYRHRFYVEDRLVATGRVVSVLCQHRPGEGMRSCPIPQALRDALAPYLEPDQPVPGSST